MAGVHFLAKMTGPITVLLVAPGIADVLGRAATDDLEQLRLCYEQAALVGRLRRQFC
jgi:hypothetical protein